MELYQYYYIFTLQHVQNVRHEDVNLLFGKRQAKHLISQIRKKSITCQIFRKLAIDC